MHLSEFIHTHHQQIIENWVEFAETLLPWAENMSEEGLRDHAEEILTAVVSDMETPQSERQQSEKSKGNAKEGELSEVGWIHASERLESGLSLDQLVAEYRALRSSVLRLWEQEHGEKHEELTRFNEAIDEVLAKSSAQYLETVDATRERFLGILGHDLRNPIHAIRLGANLLMNSKDTKTIEIATLIHISGQGMDRIVNDLLDLTRTRLGSGIPVTTKPMDLKSVCEPVIAELQSIHPDSQIRLELKGDLAGEWDSDRISQVVLNLVANAVQYGTPGRPVSVLVQGNDDEVWLKVHNEGSPIPENEQETIFASMVRHQPGGQNNEMNAKGLGLGLFIASEIVKAHAGTISIISTEKKGTTFKVKIPRRPASETA